MRKYSKVALLLPFFPLCDPMCWQIMIRSMKIFILYILLFCNNSQFFHHKINYSVLRCQRLRKKSLKKSVWIWVWKLVFGFGKKKVICTDLHICVCKCLIHLHNCYKKVQFIAANGTSTIRGKHWKMHFSSKTHKHNLCIWQLIWALYQTFHRVERQNRKTN